MATLAAMAALSLTATAARAASTLCNSQTASVAGGSYIVENNEWNSSASECITTDGNADFTVANSSISLSGGAPGGYPAIYKGCHWGDCTSNSGLPIEVGSLTPGKVTTSWTTSQPGGGAYDVAYDIWYNQSPTTSGQPNAEEMMIWLNHTGGVEPAGSVVATNVSLGGHTYNIWEDQMSSWKDVSYVMTSGTTSVSNLDIATLAADSVSRGYMTDSDYLIDLEAGFELWQGGVGLAADSYSVNVNAGGGGTTATGPITGYEGLCLDDRSASTAEYNPIQVYTCNGTGAQQWTVEPNNSLEVLGMCLDVDAAGTANGTLVDLYTCNGTAAQVWEPQPDGALLNPNSGKCLDDTGYGGSGTQVQIWSCSGNGNQSWRLP
ncbi:MAG TPA: ricin-type beta-trefoil lectin domain protein [Trebonia sp.]|nr:ricin-type beta-trefoil lectin domain protein [Trebonia sp.]